MHPDGPENGKQMSIYYEFGDIRRFFSSTNGERSAEGDPVILPGESYIFKVGDNYRVGYDLRKKLGRFEEASTGYLEHQFTNFGDGTGLQPGGTPWRTPKKKQNSIR